ncbi:hypothetical protein Kurepalu1_00012 [Pseudomonas phage vB_PpuP-Kurepalu-1]
MRTNGQTPAVIFSLPVEDGDAARAILSNFGVDVSGLKVGEGCYRGTKEIALYLPLVSFTDEARACVKAYEQECVLVLDNQYNAFLSFGRENYPSYTGLGGGAQAKYIGEFKELPKATAERHQSWSCFGGRYYVAH